MRVGISSKMRAVHRSKIFGECSLALNLRACITSKQGSALALKTWCAVALMAGCALALKKIEGVH